MIQTLRKIGNSNSILIPKAMSVTCGITDEVEMEVLGDSIMLRSTKKKARDGSSSHTFQKIIPYKSKLCFCWTRWSSCIRPNAGN